MRARRLPPWRVLCAWHVWAQPTGRVVSCALAPFVRAENFRVLTLSLLALLLLGAGALPVSAMAGSAPEIPPRAKQYRALLVRSAHYAWGLDAPIAVMAAQIHQESAWNPAARSPVGARGLAQFMPATAAWMPNAAPHLPELANVSPHSPAWALLACAAYDKWLWDRTSGATPCDRMSFALSGYNGGPGWVTRDKALAAKKGLDPLRWPGNVASVNAGRRAAAWKENRGYVRRILGELAPLYEAAGWGKGVGCE